MQLGFTVDPQHRLVPHHSPALHHLAIHRRPQVRRHRRCVPDPLIEPAQGFGVDPRVAVASEETDHHGPKQLGEMALVGPGIPSQTPVDGLVKTPGEGTERLMTGMAGQEDVVGPEVLRQVGPHRIVRLVAIGRGQGQGPPGVQIARPRQCKGVILEPEPIRGRSKLAFFHRGGQPVPQLGAVVASIETGLVRVDLQPPASASADTDCRPLVFDQTEGILHRLRSDTQGNRPPAGIVPFRHAAQEEPLLPQFHLSLLHVHGHQRIARLLGPGVHDLLHRLSGLFRQGLPQVLGGGVGVLMPPEVALQPAAERLRADIGAQHPDHRGALAVADAVEDLADLLGVAHFHLDGVGALEPVQRQGPAEVRVDELRPHVPFREQMVHRQEFDPGGKPLVEPQMGPPLHGDEVAEPLVRQLVGDDNGHPLARARRRLLGVHQNRGLAVGHRAPVLHGPGGEVGDGQQVHLRQRIGDVKVFVEERQRPRGHVQREPPLLPPTHRRVDPHRHAFFSLRLDVVELADDERQQIGGHHRGLGEPHGLETAVPGLDRARRHVRNRHPVQRHHQRHREHGLLRRLVPARERAPGVRGLELGDRHDPLFAVHPVDTPVEPVHLVVQLPGELDGQPCRSRLQLFAENERDGVFLLVRLDVLGLTGHSVPLQHHRVDLQLRRVQHDPAGGRLHFDVHGFAAVEGKPLEIRLEGYVITRRVYVCRQQHPFLFSHSCSP